MHPEEMSHARHPLNIDTDILGPRQQSRGGGASEDSAREVHLLRGVLVALSHVWWREEASAFLVMSDTFASFL